MKTAILTLLIGLMLTVGGSVVRADPFDNGMEADERGDYSEAAKWFKLAAKQKKADAQILLGVYYAKGKGVAQDYREAAKWYRLAADQGKAHAQLLLGSLYENGQGVAQDYREAAKWYRLAADQGEARAQYRLGVFYSKGQDVTQDYREAAKWFRLAADQGYAFAQYRLGISYENGQGVTQNYREAAKLHRLAAQQGFAEAQFLLAGFYNDGRGVPQDYLLGYMWSSLAASKLGGVLGDGAAASRTIAERKMTSAQVLEAQEMAKRCEESNYKKCDKQEANQSGPSVTSIPMKSEGGIYVIPVLINNAITLDFVVDSGASDVSIPADVVTTLMRTGTIKQSDFLDQKTYRLADGSTVPSQTFRIRSLKVGNNVIENVNGSIAPVKGVLLLGQSFLSRFKSWSVDNNKHALVLE